MLTVGSSLSVECTCNMVYRRGCFTRQGENVGCRTDVAASQATCRLSGSQSGSPRSEGLDKCLLRSKGFPLVLVPF